jgi:hypothetical protein
MGAATALSYLDQLRGASIIAGGIVEGVPRDGQRVGHVGSEYCDCDGHPDVVPPRRSSDAISAEAMAGSAGKRGLADVLRLEFEPAPHELPAC